MMAIGSELVQPQLGPGQESNGEEISKLLTQRTVWLVPSRPLDFELDAQVNNLHEKLILYTS